MSMRELWIGPFGVRWPMLTAERRSSLRRRLSKFWPWLSRLVRVMLALVIVSFIASAAGMIFAHPNIETSVFAGAFVGMYWNYLDAKHERRSAA